MTSTIESLHKEILELRKELAQIKFILQEKYELSDEAVMKLAEARKTDKSEYLDLDEI